MQKAKAFFYVSMGILALAGAFALGAQTAQGQAKSTPVGGAGVVVSTQGFIFGSSVILSNGDIWGFNSDSFTGGPQPQFVGNIFSGAPVQATETTWGRIKAERR